MQADHIYLIKIEIQEVFGRYCGFYFGRAQWRVGIEGLSLQLRTPQGIRHPAELESRSYNRVVFWKLCCNKNSEHLLNGSTFYCRTIIVNQKIIDKLSTVYLDAIIIISIPRFNTLYQSRTYSPSSPCMFVMLLLPLQQETLKFRVFGYLTDQLKEYPSTTGNFFKKYWPTGSKIILYVLTKKPWIKSCQRL